MLHYICIQELSSFFFYVMLFHIILSIKCSCHCWWKQLKWSILYRAGISDLTNVFLHTFYSTWTLNSSNLDTKTKVYFWGISQYIAFVLLLYFVNGYSGLENSEKIIWHWLVKLCIWSLPDLTVCFDIILLFYSKNICSFLKT